MDSHTHTEEELEQAAQTISAALGISRRQLANILGSASHLRATDSPEQVDVLLEIAGSRAKLNNKE